MNRAQIVELVRVALSTVLNREIPEIDEDVRLFEDLALDSTSVIELLMALEDTTEMEIDPDELEPAIFRTVGSLADYVEAGLTRSAA